jgi:hypothetical protein
MNKAAVQSFLVAVVLVALGVMAEAQQPKKIFRIGYLATGSRGGKQFAPRSSRTRLRRGEKHHHRGPIRGREI